MEAIGEFIPDQADRPRSAMPGRLRQLGTVPGAAGDAVDVSVAAALALLRTSSGSAAEDVARLDFFEASEFAEGVEDLSRTVEYLQIIAAAAVDRTRREAAAGENASAGWGSDMAAASAGGWLTGWNLDPGETDGRTNGSSDDGSPAGGPTGALSDAPSGAAGTCLEMAVSAGGGAVTAAAVCAVADDGYRNTAEFLRARLRISAPEAKRRLTLAAELLPRTGIDGHDLPPSRPELAAAVAEGTVATRTATIIALSLERVRHVAAPETAATMEHALTLTAIENDPDFLTRIARRWTEALDQDGAQPSEGALRRLQGAFIRKPRHGMQHLEIFATADQFEHLVTVMNSATNPRTGTAPGTGQDALVGTVGGAVEDGLGEESQDGRGPAPDGTADGTAAGAVQAVDAADVLDKRSRPQLLLDGLVGACKAALAAGGLPATGGLRPQIMATIDYRDLLQRLGGTGTPGGAGSLPNFGAGSLNQGTGSLMFTGPVTASTVRKLACDADIIPVVLGGDGQVLDIGRTSRVFPPHIRKALVARDQGCAFPQCTIPASWCEAHHIDYWSRGGSTGTDNGTLLCSHHHHLIHKEQWSIRMRAGIPWFIPPPHIDPSQSPRRNRYFRLE